MPRIYVMQSADAVVLSRRRPGLWRVRPVRRSWSALAEIPPRTGRPPGETALVFAPPVVLGAAAAAFAAAGVGVAVGGAALIASTYLTPVLRGRLADRRLRRPDNIVLRGSLTRAAFDRTLDLADRISATWPGLGALVDADEASELLAEALWQLAAVLAQREELDAVLATAPADLAQASVELRSQVSVAKAARARVETDFLRREAGLRRTEDAGQDFIREQHMRQAIRAADRTLRTTPPGLSLGDPGLLSTSHSPNSSRDGAPEIGPLGAGSAGVGPVGGSPAGVGAAGLDSGAELADHTRSVLAAYRELTADLTA